MEPKNNCKGCLRELGVRSLVRHMNITSPECRKAYSENEYSDVIMKSKQYENQRKKELWIKNRDKRLVQKENTIVEKNHTCELCGSSFAKSWYLKTHIKNVHENLRNYQCDYCAEFFSSKGSLTAHEKRYHTKQFDVKCEFCGKGFVSQSRLQCHINYLHGNKKKNTCHVCGEDLMWLKSLREHIAKVHEDIRNPIIHFFDDRSPSKTEIGFS